jgi:hypothetical protein
MDHSPLEGIFKALWPIIIFIIVAIASNSSQKRKKAQEDALRRQRHKEIETAQQPSSETGRPSIPGPVATKQEDWKRTIEDVLEEMGLPVERKPEPPPMPEPAVQKKAPPPGESPEEESQSLEDLEPEIVQEKAIDEKMKAHLAIQENAYALGASPIDNPKVYSTATSEAISAGASETPREKTQTAYDSGAEDLQKFIVWSEVLGKPVTLKDEEIK